MKIAFFDIREDEIAYYKNHCSNFLEQIYFKESINRCSFHNYDFSDILYLSTTVMSDLSDDVLLRFPNLKFIFTRSMGFDHIDLKYCKKHNVMVFNCPHYGDRTVAEFAFALLLNLSRRINSGIKKIEDTRFSDEPVGFELYNKTIGIIGLGAIGERVADIAKGFGMKIFAYDKNYKENYRYLPFKKLLSIADVISINCPLNQETKYLFNDEAFNNLKRGAILINVARGEIIDTKALIYALESGKVSYAGLDVIECESFFKNSTNSCQDFLCQEKNILNKKLHSMPNVIMTPHIAYLTREALLRINETTIMNIDCCVKNNYNLCLKNQVLL